MTIMAKATKSLILAKFTELLKETDLDKITVTTLVSECEISRQTFYYHFADIEALINWSIKEKTAECLRQAKAASNVKDATVIYLSYIEANRFFIEKYLKSSLSAFSIKLFRNCTMEFIIAFYPKIVKSNHLSAEDTKFAIEFISNAIVGVIISSVMENRKIDIENFADRMNRTIFEKFI